MFRPVQNPDDEEVEGRVRTRTRTKELVTTLIFFPPISSFSPFLLEIINPTISQNWLSSVNSFLGEILDVNDLKLVL